MCVCACVREREREKERKRERERERKMSLLGNVIRLKCFVGVSMLMCLRFRTRLGVRRLIRLVVHQIIKYETGEEMQK